jgi:hypothetical protein
MYHNVNLPKNPPKTKYMNFPISVLDCRFMDITSAMIQARDHGLKCQADNYFSKDPSDWRGAIEQAMKFFEYNMEQSVVDRLMGKLGALEQTEVLNLPKAGLSADIICEYIDFDKSELEVASLRAYIAVKSILGKQAWKVINNDYLLARMFGYPSVRDLPPLDERTDEMAKYSKRYHMDKIKKALKEKWHVSIEGVGVRGFAVSTKLDFRDLVKAVQQDKIKRAQKKKAQAAKESAIRREVLIELNAITA